MEGGCSCGAIRYRIDGTPHRVTHCYCEHCRRTSGAPLLTWAECRLAQVTIIRGAPACHETRPGVTRQFCSRCGTQLTYQRADDPDSIDVTACSLDTPDAVTPEDHVWCDRQVPWLELADNLPRYRLQRDGRQ
jgi:hypothetical protein